MTHWKANQQNGEAASQRMNLAVSVLLIASHDRPFSGEISVKPDLLLQVRPD
jgi:hypothetical protein